MAAEKGFVAPSISTLRRIMKPVISTDVMGNRNVEVKAVGARAEPALLHSHARVPDAVIAAEMEEERISAMQREKAARLQQFQTDVRRRVRQINKTKRRQQLHNDYQTMEKEHNRIKSSLRASDDLIDRKDRVVQSSAPSFHPTVCADLREIQRKAMRQEKEFEKQNHEMHAFTVEARQKLSGRKVESDLGDLEETMPGGRWVTYETQAKATKMRGEPLDSGDSSDGENQYLRDDEENKDIINRFKQSRKQADQVKYFPTDPQPELRGEDGEEGGGDSSRDDDAGPTGGSGEEGEYRARCQRVQFNLRSIQPPQAHTAARTAKKKGGRRRPVSAPDLRSGVTEFAEKKRQEQQKLNYRRLYSDLERQSVRDNQRRKQQRSQIQKIKKEKEALRRQEEENARRLVEPRDPVTGETTVEASLRQQLERSHLQEVLHDKEEQRQKQREMIRYLDALRSNLREKLHKQGRELPSLCCCGETLWDTHPETCANNCFYYKNHRAYARALQSLLTSSEVM